MPIATVSPGLVERAIDLLIEHLRDVLNGYISWVYDAEQPDDEKINLPPVPPNDFYISEAIEPLRCPSVFVVADRTEHNLAAQNFAAQSHTVLVGLLAEDLGVQRLQRKVWRYGKALYLALHDHALGDIKVLVRSLDYGPTLQVVTTQPGQTRLFRKDVVLRCEVLHYESVPLTR